MDLKLASSSAAAYIGCAGWNIPTSIFDSPNEGSRLEQYAGIFSAVEINSSFYRSHRAQTYARWRAAVPVAFRFSVKMPKQITHTSRLININEALSQFVEQVSHLREKLGCILVQLPPSLQYDRCIVENFFTELRSLTNATIVCEPRHISWEVSMASDTFEKYAVSPVLADPPKVNIASKSSSLRPIYIRLHGSPVMYRSTYSSDYLKKLHVQITNWKESGRDVWCIFDNTADGAAFHNAYELLGHINNSSSKQSR